MRTPIGFFVLLALLAEIAIFILVGQAIGVAATLGLVLLDMIVGLLLLRRQGSATMGAIRAELAAQRTPGKPLFDGAVLGLAALLLILPGFLSDAAALLLLVPAVRRWIWTALQGQVQRKAASYSRFRPARQITLELEQGEYGPTSSPDSPWNRKPRQGD